MAALTRNFSEELNSTTGGRQFRDASGDFVFGEASSANTDSVPPQSVYIIVGLVLAVSSAFFLGCVVYVISADNRRRSNRDRRHRHTPRKIGTDPSLSAGELSFADDATNKISRTSIALHRCRSQTVIVDTKWPGSADESGVGRWARMEETGPEVTFSRCSLLLFFRYTTKNT